MRNPISSNEHGLATATRAAGMALIVTVTAASTGWTASPEPPQAEPYFVFPFNSNSSAEDRGASVSNTALTLTS
jgi:hypothetical protein